MAIGGYDERYFRVANYSNIELWGRFKEYGLKFTITDDFTFHQPHPANRADIQIQLEPDDVIVRNTRIRQDFGQILTELEVPEDTCAWSVILPQGTNAHTSEMNGVEFLQGEDTNTLIAQARGTNILLPDPTDMDGLNELLPQIEKVLTNPQIGCVGPAGGTMQPEGKKTITKPAAIDVACGTWLAFARKPAIRNGLRMADLGDQNLSLMDFCLQMHIWGGRTSHGMEKQQGPGVDLNTTFINRWDFL